LYFADECFSSRPIGSHVRFRSASGRREIRIRLAVFSTQTKVISMLAKLIVALRALISACEGALVARSRVGSTRALSDSNSKLSAEAHYRYEYTERIPRTLVPAARDRALFASKTVHTGRLEFAGSL